jgi:hypothetical protein
MVYKGYELTGAAADFVSVPRYGAGSLVLHRAAFAALGPDHATVVLTHTLAALLALALLPLCLPRLLGPAPASARAAVVAAWALALTPQLVVDARSESILTLGVATLALGWLHFAAWWEPDAGRARRAAHLLVAAAAATLAALTRPELLALAPALFALHATSRRRAAPALRRRDRAAALAAVLLAAATLQPHLAHLQRTTAEQIATGALPPLDLRAAMRAIGVVAGGSALFRAAIFPTPWLALALVWLWPAARAALPPRPSLALLALALLSTGLVAIDLPDVSLPRLHALAAALAILALAPAAVAGWAALRDRLPRRPTSAAADASGSAVAAPLVFAAPAAPAAPAALAALAALVALATVAAIPSAIARLQPTTEQDEDALYRDLAAQLPDATVCVARLDDGDAPSSRVHRNTPDYLFSPPHRRDRLLPLAALAAPARLRGCAYVVAVLGTRCYLRERGHTPRAGMVDACVAARRWAAAAGARALIERTVPNLRSDGFGWAPDDAELALSAWLVASPPSAPPSAP